MEDLLNIAVVVMNFLPLIIGLIIWDSIWKLAALWKAAQNKQLVWFLTIAILNTAGILPILYIIFSKKK